MGVIKFLRDITGLFNWNTDDNPTNEQTYMNAVKNWQETEKNLVDTILWQPTTAYAVGNMVKTPSLKSQWCLVCTTAGTSGANEPSYSGKTVGSSVSDGSVTWVIDRITTTQDIEVLANIVTYNATNVVTAYNMASSVNGGTIKVIGNHIVLFDVTLVMKADSSTSRREVPCGIINNSSLIPEFGVLLDVERQTTNAEYAKLHSKYHSSASGYLRIIANSSFVAGEKTRLTGMYWI